MELRLGLISRHKKEPSSFDYIVLNNFEGGCLHTCKVIDTSTKHHDYNHNPKILQSNISIKNIPILNTRNFGSVNLPNIGQS